VGGETRKKFNGDRGQLSNRAHSQKQMDRSAGRGHTGKLRRRVKRWPTLGAGPNDAESVFLTTQKKKGLTPPLGEEEDKEKDVFGRPKKKHPTLRVSTKGKKKREN